MKKTSIVVKVMPTAADILGRTIIAGLCGFIGAKMYCDAQAFKAKKIKHRKVAEPSFDDEIDVTDLDDKIDGIAAKQPNTVPVVYPNLVAVQQNPYYGGCGCGYGAGAYNF